MLAHAKISYNDVGTTIVFGWRKRMTGSLFHNVRRSRGWCYQFVPRQHAHALCDWKCGSSSNFCPGYEHLIGLTFWYNFKWTLVVIFYVQFKNHLTNHKGTPWLLKEGEILDREFLNLFPVGYLRHVKVGGRTPHLTEDEYPLSFLIALNYLKLIRHKEKRWRTR